MRKTTPRRRIELPVCGYVRVQPEGTKVHKTRTLIADRVFADFDRKGKLIGVEVI